MAGYRAGLLRAARRIAARAGVIRRDAKWYKPQFSRTAFYTPDGFANDLLRLAADLRKEAKGEG